MSKYSRQSIFDFKRIIRAFKFSVQGIRSAWKNEAAFRQETVLFFMLLPVAYFFTETFAEFLLLVAALVFILVVEILNSAIEAVVDRFGSQHHELSGNAKDMGSAAVLLSMLVALLVWLSVLL